MFGHELRNTRTQRGLGLRSCAARLNYSAGQLSKVETGKRAPSRQLAQAVDALFSTGEYFEQLWMTESQGVPSVTGGSSDEPLIAHELPNGKVVFVPASRRQFIQGVGAAAAASLLSSIPAAPAAAADVKPLAHFQAARRLLIDTDNMLGAAAQQHADALGAVTAGDEHHVGIADLTLLDLLDTAELLGVQIVDIGHDRCARGLRKSFHVALLGPTDGEDAALRHVMLS